MSLKKGGSSGGGEEVKKVNFNDDVGGDPDYEELSLKVQIRDLQDRCMQLEQQNQQQQKLANQAQKAIQEAKELKAETDALRTQLEASEKAQQKRAGGMQGEVRNLQDQLKDLRGQNKQLRLDLGQQQELVQAKEKELNDVTSKKASKDDAVRLQAQNQKLQKDLEQVRQENKQLPILISKLKQAEQQLQEVMDQDDAASNASSEAASVAASVALSTSRKRSDDSEAAKNLEEKLRKEKKERSDLQRELDDVRHELSLIKDNASHQQLFREISTLKKNLRESESTQAEFRKENMALKKSVADLSIRSSSIKVRAVSTPVPPQAATAIAGQHNEAKIAALTNENDELREYYDIQ
eukprot:TRINITY_DN7134_c0_g2_i2.p1 TRINITY_DN7134_c0_g2~~TRINITY_DN7134_c0_g2_i2.p1  ORF type:complete len:353 (+),score=80.46 TRINITY_DN7134_c0_g2_i2:428-1486(+)